MWNNVFSLSYRTRNYLRLFLTFVGASLAAGLIPGQSLFVQLLVEYGLFASQCEKGQLTCPQQELSVALGFNIGQTLSLLGLFPIGWAFDRYGGRFVCLFGTLLCAVGLILVQIPLYGVALGYDHITSWIFPFVLCLADMGSIFSAYGLYAFLYHFPDGQTLVTALGGCASSTVPALLPNAFQLTMQITGWTLPYVFSLYSCCVILCWVILYMVLPTHEEFKSEGKRALGIPLPESSDRPEVIADFKRGWATLSVNLRDHIWFIFTIGFVEAFAAVYTSLLGEYGGVVLGNKAAGHELSAQFTALTATFGTVAMLFLSIWCDRIGKNGFKVIAWCTAMCCVASTFTVACPTWWLQIITVLSTVFMNVVLLPITIKYSVAYAMPTRFGVFNSTLALLVTLAYMAAMIIDYALVTAVPTSQMSTGMLITSVIGTLAALVWSWRFQQIGFPAHPVLLPEDEEELAKTFGCQTLEDVMYMTNIDSKTELVELMCSTDPKDMENLCNRIDVFRYLTNTYLYTPLISARRVADQKT